MKFCKMIVPNHSSCSQKMKKATARDAPWPKIISHKSSIIHQIGGAIQQHKKELSPYVTISQFSSVVLCIRMPPCLNSKKSLPRVFGRVKAQLPEPSTDIINNGILVSMNETEFRAFLKRNRRKASAIEQIVSFVPSFEAYLAEHYPDKNIEQTTVESLESYVSWIESEPGESASKPLWALRYYFDFIENQELSDLAGELRSERIKRKPFYVRNFRGVNPQDITSLEAQYIENTDQMMDAGRTPRLRQALAQQTGLPLEVILEFVTLSDLARLGAVRSVRARLYFDAGLNPELIATWEPEKLHAMLVEFVNRTGFDGIAPLPKEVRNLVADARSLPKIVQY